MKRTSTYAVAIMGSVFFFERGFDVIADSVFDSTNKGVSVESEKMIIQSSEILHEFFNLSHFRNCGRILKQIMSHKQQLM